MTQLHAPSSHPHRVRQIFSLTMGVGAALLFWQQLMLGRILLPVFGSVPTVWLVSLAVFQTVLLFAYGFAHLSKSWPRMLMVPLIILMICAAAAQFVLYPNLTALGGATNVDAISVIMALLGLSGVGLFLLSMISPMLQSVYVGLPQPDAKDPYFFYGASNIGSFVGLLIFPLVLEPMLGVSTSQHLWFICAAIFACLLIACLLLAFGSKQTVDAVDASVSDARPPYLKWLFYSFVPCALSFGATSHLISDIAPLPLLSMVPLALYLLTFVLAFSRKDWFSDTWAILHIICVGMYVSRALITEFKLTSMLDIVMILIVFFVTAWQCHRQLALLRPSPKHLTAYYMTLASGGVLGGMVSVFVVPFVFPLPIEFMVLLVVALLHYWPQDRVRLQLPHMRVFYYCVAGLIAVALCVLPLPAQDYPIRSVIVVLALMMVCFVPSIMAISAVAMLGMVLMFGHSHPLVVQRDFFGIKRVIEEDGFRTLMHGTTIHGKQHRAPITTEPLLYYGKGSGLHDVITLFKPQRIGAVGLGTGTVACMPPSGSNVRIFEIDAGVEMLARTYFTYLHDCPAEIILGDARMTLAADTHSYDMLLLDAFSSDAIPVHLLTKEMVEIYKQRIGKSGMLLVHISNRYLNLRVVMAGAAKALGWKAAIKTYLPKEINLASSASVYVAMSPDAAAIDTLLKQDGWKLLDDNHPILWTDDHISIIPILRFGFIK